MCAPLPCLNVHVKWYLVHPHPSLSPRGRGQGPSFCCTQAVYSCLLPLEEIPWPWGCQYPLLKLILLHFFVHPVLDCCVCSSRTLKQDAVGIVFKLLLLVIHKGCHLYARYTMTKMEKKKKNNLLNSYRGRIFFFFLKKILKISNPLNTWPQRFCGIVQENLEV